MEMHVEDCVALVRWLEEAKLDIGNTPSKAQLEIALAGLQASVDSQAVLQAMPHNSRKVSDRVELVNRCVALRHVEYMLDEMLEASFAALGVCEGIGPMDEENFAILECGVDAESETTAETLLCDYGLWVGVQTSDVNAGDGDYTPKAYIHEYINSHEVPPKQAAREFLEFFYKPDDVATFMETIAWEVE